MVTGETATGKFYIRWSSGPAGLRGFSIGYDKALAGNVDRLVVAIANSFEPFPAADPPTSPSPAKPAVASGPDGAPSPPQAKSFGTGLVVANGLVVTAALAVKPCRYLSVETRPAERQASDDGSGLVLLKVEGLHAPALARLRPTALAGQDRLVVLSYGDHGDGGAVPVALAGEATAARDGIGAIVPLQPGGSGSPVFDRQGRLAGIVTAAPADKGAVAGIVPQRTYAMAGPAELAGFLSKADVPSSTGDDGRELSTGEIAEPATKAIVRVDCQP